jgi:hypothetical protein
MFVWGAFKAPLFFMKLELSDASVFYNLRNWDTILMGRPLLFLLIKNSISFLYSTKIATKFFSISLRMVKALLSIEV